MTVLSNENAKARLEEFRILLKYMPFLQKNGFSDCGRGQIMGQMSLLQEFLSETQTSEEILNLQYKDSIMPSVSNINNNTSDSISDTSQYYATTNNETNKQINDGSKNSSFDLDNIILENDTSYDGDNKLQTSRWLRPFKNDDPVKKKLFDTFEKNEITHSWKEKIRKMTQSDII
ncbi:MAG TPA: hypothetical protein VFM28_01335 [Nitrososphaeraceae archaeon]|jgi:hypothetical protein|nr:hypothetical protein [Nitrososphaeraceae archaeon]